MTEEKIRALMATPEHELDKQSRQLDLEKSILLNYQHSTFHLTVRRKDSPYHSPVVEECKTDTSRIWLGEPPLHPKNLLT